MIADIRKLRGKLFQPRQQNLVGKCWCTAERQRSCRLAAGKLIGGFGEKAQSVIDQGRINPAGVGKPQSSLLAMEKLDPKPAFEGLDAVTDGACSKV